MRTDAVVVGLGVMGSAAAFALARRGVDVLAIERQPRLGHDRGSSHGESRIIRQAYFEDPAYVPLVQQAWRRWRELEERQGISLLRRTGGLMLGEPGSRVIRGALRSANEHGLPHQLFGAADLRRRFPAFRLEPDIVGVFEPRAGYIRAEEAVRALAREAECAGAVLWKGRAVEAVHLRSDGVDVVSAGETIGARKLVLAVGGWTSLLFPALPVPLRVERQVMVWFRMPSPDECEGAGLPVFIAAQAGGRQFYGVPTLDGTTVKVAQHHGGTVTSADTIDRRVTPADTQEAERFVKSVLPGLGRIARTSVCFYTNTPDDHFVLAAWGEFPHVAVMAGFSGHGFKFAPELGDAVARWLLDEEPLPALFGIDRARS
jgi:sarcosine oxidase